MTLLLLCAALTGWAQTSAGYRPLLVEGRSCRGVELSAGGPNRELTYTIMGDTVVGGEKFKKLYCVLERTYNDKAIHYCLAMLETDRKVYIVKAGETVKTKLYDFSLDEGDVAYGVYDGLVGKLVDAPLSQGRCLTVVRVDTLSLADGSFRRLLLRQETVDDKDTETLGSDVHLIWIEGIGAYNLQESVAADITISGWSYSMLGCTQDDKPIFSASDFSRLAPPAGYHPLLKEGKRWNYLHFTYFMTGWQPVTMQGRGLRMEVLESDPMHLLFSMDAPLAERICWVEGVGSSAGLWPYPDAANLSDVAGEELPIFVSCYEDGVCIATKEDFEAAGTVLSVETVGSDSQRPASADSYVYDLQGRRLTAKPHRGVYIQQGRKYVVRWPGVKSL